MLLISMWFASSHTNHDESSWSVSFSYRSWDLQLSGVYGCWVIPIPSFRHAILIPGQNAIDQNMACMVVIMTGRRCIRGRRGGRCRWWLISWCWWQLRCGLIGVWWGHVVEKKWGVDEGDGEWDVGVVTEVFGVGEDGEFDCAECRFCMEWIFCFLFLTSGVYVHLPISPAMQPWSSVRSQGLMMMDFMVVGIVDGCTLSQMYEQEQDEYTKSVFFLFPSSVYNILVNIMPLWLKIPNCGLEYAILRQWPSLASQAVVNQEISSINCRIGKSIRKWINIKFWSNF